MITAQDKKFIESFSKEIQIKFKDLKLIKEALTHRSFVNESKKTKEKHNERMEFLGDAVLELAVTEFLFDKYPGLSEGVLTSFRAALVRTESLAEEASKLNFGKYIFMSKGEELTGGRQRQYILANTFEAVIGSIYLDQGYKKAQEFILKNVCYKIDKIMNERLDIDPKSKLQEISQDIVKLTPTYELVSSVGPDHSKTFTMAVMIGQHKFAEGKGKSKQEAEQFAAKNAIENWDFLYKKYFSA